jgi:hypothetical protein
MFTSISSAKAALISSAESKVKLLDKNKGEECSPSSV